MKIAIISDIHDNLANLGHFFEIIKDEEIEKIICCGDVCNFETLEFLNNIFLDEIFLIKGNNEVYQEEEILKLKNISYLGRTGIIKIENNKIGICHEPYFIDDLLEQNPDLDFIFYGHTHQPWMSNQGKTILINPGTLGGVFYKACFAIWDSQTKNAKLKIL